MQRISICTALPVVYGTKLALPLCSLKDLFDMIQYPLALWERELRVLTALTKGTSMAEETGKEMHAQAQELIAHGTEVVAEYYEEGRNQAIAWQQQLENQVREKPLQSLLMAVGVGLLLGMLRRR